MFTENLDFIRKAVECGNPEYGILSLTADTLDAMRSVVSEDHFEEINRYKFISSMNKILEGLYELDEIIDKAEGPEEVE